LLQRALPGFETGREMLSAIDESLLHQIPDTFRHVGTRDRYFYDRCCFNMHASSDEIFVTD